MLPVRTGTSRDGAEWKSQEFVFEYFEEDAKRYADRVVLSVMNDRISEYDLHVNDEVRIGFSHKVREYQGRYYNDLHIYKFAKLKAALPAAATVQQPAPTETQIDWANMGNG